MIELVAAATSLRVKTTVKVEGDTGEQGEYGGGGFGEGGEDGTGGPTRARRRNTRRI